MRSLLVGLFLGPFPILGKYWVEGLCCVFRIEAPKVGRGQSLLVAHPGKAFEPEEKHPIEERGSLFRTRALKISKRAKFVQMHFGSRVYDFVS